MTDPAIENHEPEGVSDPWRAATADAAEPDAPPTTSPTPPSPPASAAPPAPPAPPTSSAAAVRPARAGRPGPEGLPENWSGRDAIREPPHAGYREATPAPPRPVRLAPRPRRQPEPPGTDLLTGLQRWLIRSTARNARREIEDSVRRTIGSARSEPEDIWGVATTEPPPDLTEAPECAWCPVCRAARRMRESGPGLSSVSDAVASAVQDAFSALDGVLSRTTAASGDERPAEPGSRQADSAGDHDHAERASDEPGDRG